MKIDLQKLDNKLKVSQKLDDDDVLVMELLNCCHNTGLLTKEILEKFKCRHFLKAIKILNEGAANKVLFNMSGYEFIKENLDSVEEVSLSDEEEFF